MEQKCCKIRLAYANRVNSDGLMLDEETIKSSVESYLNKPLSFNSKEVGRVIEAEWNDTAKCIEATVLLDDWCEEILDGADLNFFTN